MTIGSIDARIDVTFPMAEGTTAAAPSSHRKTRAFDVPIVSKWRANRDEDGHRDC
jgi:hypothetical protein